MFYRKIDKTCSGNLTAQNLVLNVRNGELEQEYDQAIQNPMSVCPGKNITLADVQQLSEEEWASGKDIMIDRLFSCAAVLFYTYDNNDNRYHLSVAYHAPGGGINVETPDGDFFVIYATPILPRAGETDYESYKKEINKLASKYGKQNICIIDGFETSSTVFANCDGELAFR